MFSFMIFVLLEVNYHLFCIIVCICRGKGFNTLPLINFAFPTSGNDVVSPFREKSRYITAYCERLDFFKFKLLSCNASRCVTHLYCPGLGTPVPKVIF